MRVLCLLGLIFAIAASASDPSWVRENCPRCYQTADKNYLFKVNDRIIKFSPKPFRSEAGSECIDINWVGLSNTRGETTQQDVTFPTQAKREAFTQKYLKVCRLFSGYQSYSNELSFSEGDHLTDPLVSTTVAVKITCIKEEKVAKKPEVSESVGDLVNFLSGSEPKKKNLAIYDEDRGEEARNPKGGAERLPASAAGVSGQ